MEVEVAKITLSDTIPAQHQIMRQQKGVKTSKPAKHTSSTQQQYAAALLCVSFKRKIHQIFEWFSTLSPPSFVLWLQSIISLFHINLLRDIPSSLRLSLTIITAVARAEQRAFSLFTSAENSLLLTPFTLYRENRLRRHTLETIPVNIGTFDWVTRCSKYQKYLKNPSLDSVIARSTTTEQDKCNKIADQSQSVKTSIFCFIFCQ